jgi:hypothetical protein
MPIRTQTPFNGRYKITKGKLKGVGGVLAPVSVTDLIDIYGDPGMIGQWSHVSNWVETDKGKLIHESTFVAGDPAEQVKLDIWAAKVAADEPETIRGKIGAVPVLDEIIARIEDIEIQLDPEQVPE